jgi:hypothetical protein
MLFASWRCIACGAPHRGREIALSEQGHCARCSATWRDRAVLAGVLQGVGLTGTTIPEMPSDWSRPIIGIADSTVVAAALSSRFIYTNTSLARFPILDLLDPPPQSLGQAQIVTCSDVLEHVHGPVEQAAAALLSLLAPGGFAVVSVPFPADRQGERYPGLKSWRAWPEPGATGVEWVDAAGHKAHDDDPEFHPSPEPCLVLRGFTPRTFDQLLIGAGFYPVVPVDEVRRLGIPRLTSQECPVRIAYRPLSAP